MKKLAFLISVAVFAISAPASAAVLVDQSPDVNGLTAGFNAGNFSTGQNFLVQFTLASAASLTGMSIYSEYPSFGPGLVNIGDTVRLKLRKDSAGAPDNANLDSSDFLIDAIDTLGSSANSNIKRIHVSFGPTALGAGTYWAGLSGVTGEIGWNINFASPGSPGAWQLSGDGLQFSFNNDAKFAYQIEGTAGAVPEPAAWGMMILGLGMAGAAMRRRAKVSVTYA